MLCFLYPQSSLRIEGVVFASLARLVVAIGLRHIYFLINKNNLTRHISIFTGREYRKYKKVKCFNLSTLRLYIFIYPSCIILEIKKNY